MESQCQHLTMTQPNEFLKLLQIFEELLDGTLVTYKTDPVEFKLKDDTNPILLQPYPVPKITKEMFKNEVKRLVLLGVLEVANDSEWVSLFFAKHKPKLS